MGAVFESSNATGVNGDQSNNGANASGAVYVFVRNGATWGQQAYLKASNTEGGSPYGDLFGLAVSISGDTIVVGAREEDSNATGVNGNQCNNDARDSGAAYVFDLATLGVPNDECTGAIPLALGLNAGLSTVGATTSQPPMSCGTGGSDSWYSYYAECTALHTFDTCSSGTSFNTILELYTGCCGALTSIACNDDTCGRSASVTAPLTQGFTYFLRLGGFGGSTGTADIRVSTGTATGRIARTTISQCPSPMTIAVTGNPNIGGSITIALSGVTGLALYGFGFLPNFRIPTPCACDVIGDGVAGIGQLFFGSSVTLAIPCNPGLIGATVETQGLEVLQPSGGCLLFNNLPFGATDIYAITIG